MFTLNTSRLLFVVLQIFFEKIRFDFIFFVKLKKIENKTETKNQNQK